MKKIFYSLLMAFSAISCFAQNVLDKTFGSNGTVLVPDIISVVDSRFDSKGNILTIAAQLNSGGQIAPVIIRHDASGVKDQSFGNNGIVVSVISRFATPYVSTLLPDDRIIIAGDYLDVGGASAEGIFVAKYKSDGSPDSSFGTHGIFRIAVPRPDVRGISVLSDGHILLGCSSFANSAFLLGLNSNGTPDTQLGTDGIRSLASPAFSFSLWGFIGLKDGNFLCLGDVDVVPNQKVAVVKVDAQGNTINSFGTNGHFIQDVYTGSGFIGDGLSRAMEMSDKSIIALGVDTSYFLLKLSGNGSPDNSFGIGGIQRLSYMAENFAEMAGGRIALAGFVDITSNNSAHRITRLNADGSVDINFGNGGYFDLDISPSGNEYPRHAIFQAPGKLVMSSSMVINNIANLALTRLDMNMGLHIADDKAVRTQVLIFPNPTTGAFTVANMPFVQGRLKVTDILGRVVYTTSVYNAGQPVFLDVPAGVYQLSVVGDSGEVIYVSLIKQ
jgi:uncharacterized delta-60 repeat protein